MEEFTFKGYIEFGGYGNFDTIFLTSKRGGGTKQDLVKKFQGIAELFSTPDVGVSFYITDKEETEQEIKEKFLKEIVGAIEGEFEDNTYWYSEYTYDNSSYDTVLRIGGHNMFDELKEFKGKWCMLKVKLKEKEVRKVYEGKVCKGSWDFGNNCKTCEKCKDTKPSFLKQDYKRYAKAWINYEGLDIRGDIQTFEEWSKDK